MNDEEFGRMIDSLYDLTGKQYEAMFVKLWETFRYASGGELKLMETDAIAWRCKQALQLIQHRKKPTQTTAQRART